MSCGNTMLRFPLFFFFFFWRGNNSSLTPCPRGTYVWGDERDYDEYFLLSLCEFLGNRKSVGQIETCCCSRHEKLLTRYLG